MRPVRESSRYSPSQRSSNNFILAQHSSENGQNNDTRDPVAGRNRVLFEAVRCYACNSKGHYGDQCPVQSGTNLAQLGIILTQKSQEIKKSMDFVGHVFY